MPIEIQPASLAQVVHSERGDLVEISDDVMDIAKRLKEIDPELYLFWDEGQEFYSVQHHVHHADGSVTENLVLTARELGANIVERVREISSEGYSYVEELERMENAAKTRRDKEITERQAPTLEKLAWALRKDLGLKKNF